MRQALLLQLHHRYVKRTKKNKTSRTKKDEEDELAKSLTISMPIDSPKPKKISPEKRSTLTTTTTNIPPASSPNTIVRNSMRRSSLEIDTRRTTSDNHVSDTIPSMYNVRASGTAKAWEAEDREMVEKSVQEKLSSKK